MRLLRVAGGALLGACAITAAAYGIVSTLPAPSVGDRIGVRLLDRLDTTRGTGGVMQLAGVTRRVTCKRLPRYRHLVQLDDGTKLILSGTHVHEVAEPARERRLATIVDVPGLAAAEADLSGSYTLYATQLAVQLEHGREVLAGAARVNGREAYRIRLTRALPQADLLVDRETLQPLVATFRSAAVSGRTLLGPSTGLYRWHGC